MDANLRARSVSPATSSLDQPDLKKPSSNNDGLRDEEIGLLDNSSSVSLSLSVVGVYKRDRVWLTLLAPLAWASLSILLTSRYVTISLVFAAIAGRPLLYYISGGHGVKQLLKKCALNTKQKNMNVNVNANVTFDQGTLDKYITAALRTQKSLSVQFIIIGVALMLYFKIGDQCGGEKMVHVAYRNAKDIILLEHRMGIEIEPHWQQVLLPYPGILSFLNLYYGRMHFVAPSATIGWLLATGRDKMYKHRTSFGVAVSLAMCGYYFVPTMPPRLLSRYYFTYLKDESSTVAVVDPVLLPWYEMIDTLRESKSVYDKLHAAHGNPYAAMPSMHTGWALWSSLAVLDGLSMNKPSWQQLFLRILMVAHVLTIMFATVVTANHYILDLAVGILCVLAGRFVSSMVCS